MTKYTRDQSQNNKNDSFVIALDYRGSQRSAYAMSFQDYRIGGTFTLTKFKMIIKNYYR